MAEKKKKTRVGAWIIVGIILLGLAGFGAGGLTGNIRTIGKVGDQEVTVSAYQRALNEQIRTLSAQFGQPLSFTDAQAFGLDQLALSQVVLLRTLDHEAASLGISVGDQQVLDRLRAIPAFQGGSGFNRETYRLALQQSGQNTAEFERDLRSETARTLLQGAVVSGIPAPDPFADQVVQYLSENRSLTWATVNAQDLTEPVPGPEAADIAAFYDENPDLFTLPESRDITYAWLTPAMIRDDMVVSDAAIAQLFEDRRDQFVQPERRLVERLVYLGQDRAEQAMARVTAGEATFDDLVAERGLTLADVDLGDMSREDLRAAGDPVFAADTGSVVGPYNSPLGPAIFRINAVLAGQDTPLEEVAPLLRDELANSAARDFINDQASQINDLLAGGATVEDLADRTDMQLGRINWRDGITDGIAAYDSFRRAAATATEGQFAELTDLSDGGLFVLRLDAIVPPTLQPLDQITDQVDSAWRAQAERDAIAARAENLAADIGPETAFDSLGLEPQVEPALTRRSFIEGTPPDFNDRIFAMAEGEVQVIAADDRALIVRLDSITPPDAKDTSVAAQRDALAENARAGIAQDIFDAYANALQQQTDTNLNQQAINAVNAQFQ